MSDGPPAALWRKWPALAARIAARHAHAKQAFDRVAATLNPHQPDYDPAKDAHDSYFAAIEAKRLRGDGWTHRDVHAIATRIMDAVPGAEAVFTDYGRSLTVANPSKTFAVRVLDAITGERTDVDETIARLRGNADSICVKCASQQEGPVPTECTCAEARAQPL